MDDYKKHTETAINVMGTDGKLLVEALSDPEFNKLLTTQEEQAFLSFKKEPNNTLRHNYRDQFSGILAKYIGWKAYKDSDLKKIKKEIGGLSKKIVDSEGELETIRDTASIISGATALVAYSETFKTSAATHKNNAETQQEYYFAALVGFCVITALVFFLSVTDVPFIKKFIADDIKSLPFSTGILALKVFLLVFAYQITQFFRKNYGAEKHLQEVYQHRSDVLQSLHAVYEALKDSPDERNKILSAGALFAYERGETGYITTKEGAGSAGDGLIDNILYSVVRGK